MNFVPETQPTEPSRKTVWIHHIDPKLHTAGVCRAWRDTPSPRSGSGTRVSGVDVSTSPKTVEEEQPVPATNLRPLGERTAHAARYYSSGDGDGLGHHGGPAEEQEEVGVEHAPDTGPRSVTPNDEDPEVIVFEEPEDTGDAGEMPRVIRAPKGPTFKERE